MKIKRYFSRLFLVIIFLASFHLHSCEGEDWCSDCNRYDCRDIYSEKILETKTICAGSKEECRDEIQRFHAEYYSTCWDCSGPHK